MSEAGPTAPVIGTAGAGAWREPVCDDPAHRPVPVASFPAPDGRERVAFFVEDGHARSVIAARSYVVCVPFDADLDRLGGMILICTRTNADFRPPATETSLARFVWRGLDPVIEPLRDASPEGTPLRRPEIPFFPTHRVVGVYRAFP